MNSEDVAGIPTTGEYIDVLLREIGTLTTATRTAGAAFFKDTTKPLDERWAVFVKLVDANILPNEIYGPRFLNECFGRRVNVYDECGMERHETMTYSEFYRRLVEWEQKDEDESKFDSAKLDHWREKILQAGYGSFTYDW